jgi:preprotein translocase subunit SecG
MNVLEIIILIIAVAFACIDITMGFISTENHRPALKHIVESTGFLMIGMYGPVNALTGTSYAGWAVIVLGIIDLAFSVVLKKPQINNDQSQNAHHDNNDDPIAAAAERLLAEQDARNHRSTN